MSAGEIRLYCNTIFLHDTFRVHVGLAHKRLLHAMANVLLHCREGGNLTPAEPRLLIQGDGSQACLLQSGNHTGGCICSP